MAGDTPAPVVAPFDITKLKFGPSVVSWDGSPLGGTKGPPKISVKPTFYESMVDQNGAQPVRKIITKMVVTITAEFKEITTAMTALLGSAKKIDSSIIGSDIYAAANRKALLITPVDTADTDAYNFPAAVILPEFDYSPSGTEDHAVSMTWECLFDTDGTLLEIGAASTPA